MKRFILNQNYKELQSMTNQQINSFSATFLSFGMALIIAISGDSQNASGALSAILILVGSYTFRLGLCGYYKPSNDAKEPQAATE
jgi:hypothetical protein